MSDSLNDTRLVVAYAADNPTTVVLVEQLFEASEIKCKVVGDTLYNNTNLATAPKPQILVHESDLPTARKIVAEFEATLSQQSSEQPDWMCASCNESNPSEFDSCWKCQKLKPN